MFDATKTDRERRGGRGNGQHERRLARSQQLTAGGWFVADRIDGGTRTPPMTRRRPGDLTARPIGRAPQPGRPAGQWRRSFRRAARHRSRRFLKRSNRRRRPGSVPVGERFRERYGFGTRRLSRRVAPNGKIGRFLRSRQNRFLSPAAMLDFRPSTRVVHVFKKPTYPTSRLFLFIIVHDAPAEHVVGGTRFVSSTRRRFVNGGKSKMGNFRKKKTIANTVADGRAVFHGGPEWYTFPVKRRFSPLRRDSRSFYTRDTLWSRARLVTCAARSFVSDRSSLANKTNVLSASRNIGNLLPIWIFNVSNICPPQPPPPDPVAAPQTPGKSLRGASPGVSPLGRRRRRRRRLRHICGRRCRRRRTPHAAATSAWVDGTCRGVQYKRTRRACACARYER